MLNKIRNIPLDHECSDIATILALILNSRLQAKPVRRVPRVALRQMSTVCAGLFFDLARTAVRFLEISGSLAHSLHHAYRSASSDFNLDAYPRRIQPAKESREDAKNHGFEQKD